MQDTVCYIGNKLSFTFTSDKFHLVMDEINKNKLKESTKNLIVLTESFSDEIHLEFYENIKNEETCKKCSDMFTEFVSKIVNLTKNISNKKYSELFDIFYSNLEFDFKFVKDNTINIEEFEKNCFEHVKQKNKKNAKKK